MSIVTSDTSPADLLDRVRGLVTEVHVTFSRRIKLAVADPAGGTWRLTSWEADYRPSTAVEPVGETVVDADLDAESGLLTVRFSEGAYFTLTPTSEADKEAIEDWELFTPDGLVLTYGPRGRWQLGSLSDPC